MTRHLLTVAALIALTMWAGSLWAGGSSTPPLTGRLVLNGNPEANKRYQATGIVLWKKGGLLEEFSVSFTTDSDGYFSFPLPSSLSADDQVVLREVKQFGSAQWVVVHIPLDVMTAPYALVAAEAKTLVSDGDLILSEAMLKCGELEVAGNVMVTNSLAVGDDTWVGNFPSNGVDVVEARDLVLEGSGPNRGRLRWFGEEVVVMEGEAWKLHRTTSVDYWDTGWTFVWDGGVSGGGKGNFKFVSGRRNWLAPNDWIAPTDGFCTWTSKSVISNIKGGGVRIAGISIRHEDGVRLDVLPVGVIEGQTDLSGKTDPIVMNFPVRRGDVVTIRYSVVVPGSGGPEIMAMELYAEMSLRFRPIGLDK